MALSPRAVTRTTPPEQAPSRQAVNLLLATTAAALLPHALQVPAWLLLFTLALAAWRFLAQNRGWRLPGGLVRGFIVVVAVLGVYRSYGTLIGRDPGTALLVVLTGLKLLELRRLRDYVLTVLLLLFLTVVAFLPSQSAWIGAYALVLVFACTVTLIRLSQPPLLPLRHALRISGVLMAKAIPLTVVCFLLFPRIQGSLWGLPHDAFAGMSGLSDEMRPGTINELVSSRRVAFRVEFEGAPPAPRDLYWRAVVLTETDGRTWSRRRDDRVAPETPERAARPVHYSVTLEPQGLAWLPALDVPVSVPPAATLRPGLVLESAQPRHRRLRYRVESRLGRAGGAMMPADPQRHLRLGTPPSERVLALVRRWRADARDPGTIVATALEYFRTQGFLYTLTPPLLGADPVDEFLFESRAGFCEHFAAAFATLMRAAGVPSRIVVGYQGGEMNAAGDYLIVRQSDAHAWVEVWLPGVGWERVDPTAAVAPQRVESGMQSPWRTQRVEMMGAGGTRAPALGALASDWIGRQWHRATLYGDALKNAWNRFVLDYGPEHQRRLMGWLGFPTPTWTSLVATLAVAVSLVLLAIAALRFVPRRRRAPAEIRCYERFCARLARVGLRRAAHEGPQAFAARAAGARPDLAAEIQAITEAYIGARYAEHARRRDDLARLVGEFRPTRLPPAAQAGGY